MQKRFLTGVFHPIEIEEFEKRDEGAPRLQYLASRWALKEALVKASGQTKLSYNEIYLKKPPPLVKVSTLPSGEEIKEKIKQKPQLAVVGELNRTLLFEQLAIIEEGGMHASLSHEDKYAVATVVLEKYEEIEL
uniref:4'-phosphopantetheinyl transferase domain-containing protein n=1 Tax=Strombidium rassoulzadegani TaxID=1082188 RepID=A0A7S3CPX8_9SPIT|mmetsp:Transcript_2796/g.4781  ORF Transcript_2796/g.4781 Transcript_2796/m.4781 type:complete len:134 (+) Transcript_2796:100-501(+)